VFPSLVGVGVNQWNELCNLNGYDYEYVIIFTSLEYSNLMLLLSFYVTDYSILALKSEKMGTWLTWYSDNE